MTTEAEAEHGWRVSSYLGDAKGRVRTALEAVKRPIPLWGAVAGVVVFVVVALIFWWAYRSPEHAARRWEAGGTATETNRFSGLVKPPGPGFFSQLAAYFGPEPDHVPGERIPVKLMDWTEPHVAVYSVPAPGAPHLHPTLRDLGDRGQAHAIDFLAKDPAVETQSWKRLQEALTDGRDSGLGEKDPFRFDRILVATVTKGAAWNPGDRMMWTRVFVQPINFSFAGYTVAATENETVKVTSVEATSTRKFSAEVGLTIPGLDGAKASFGPSNERSEKTTSEINAQYEKLGIDIMPNFLRIVRESETGGDAVGNTTVSLAVITDPYAIRKRPPRGGKDTVNSKVDDARNPDQARIQNDEIRLLVTGVHLAEDRVSSQDRPQDPITILPQAPIPHCPLMATVWMLYEQRVIQNGREYYDESRQTVSLRRDADEKRTVEVMGADDVSPAVWSIKIVPHDEQGNEQPEFLSGHLNDGAPPRELVFTDYGLASKAVHWFRTQSDGVSGKTVFNYPGNWERANADKKRSMIPVKRTLNECDPKYDPKYRLSGYAPLPKGE